MMVKQCFYCQDAIGFNASYYTMRQAMKPKYTPNRWVKLPSVVCEDCVEVHNKPTSISCYKDDVS